MSMPQPQNPQPCEHRHIRRDFLAELPGVVRSVPGNCYCVDCQRPVAAQWVDGKAVAIEETKP